MPRPLRVLIVEDSAPDAELIVRALRRAGFDPDWHRVDTEPEYAACLRPDLEVIVSDYAMPQFSGLRALEVLHESGPKIPFILVSGAIGDETAVAAMKLGATDYLLKDRLARLGPAIEQALEQRRLSRERQQAEAALRESEERLRMSVQSANVGLWDWDLTTNEVHFSPEWKSQLGHAEDEISDRFEEWKSRLHPDDIDRALRTVRAFIANPQGRYDAEFRLRHKDGSYRWIHAQGDVLPDAEGKPARLLGCHIDITDRKQADAALRASEERFRRLVEQTPDGIFVADNSGRYTDVTAAGAEMLGYKREEILRLGILDVIMPDEIPRLASELAKFSDGAITRVEWRFRRKDGSEFCGEVVGRQLPDGSFQGILRDITERKQAEAELRESDLKYRQLVHALPAAVYTCDAAGRILLYNAAAVKLWGREPKPGHDRWCGSHRLFTPAGKRLPLARRPMAVAVMQGKPIRDAELIVERPDGSRSHVLAFPDPIYDSSGAITGAVNMLVDITALKVAEAERKRLEQEILEIGAREQRRIGQELHDDLCQWLTGTEYLASALANDLATRSPADAARALKIANAMRQGNARARTLAHGLAPAVIEAAGLTGALRELATSAGEMFRVRCLFDGPETVALRNEVAALQLYRIAQEAISNAVRHGAAREVHILLQPAGDRVTLLIRDDGSGIPQPPPETPGMGLRTMRYRAGIIGATLEIRPGASGGTEIACIFPRES